MDIGTPLPVREMETDDQVAGRRSIADVRSLIEEEVGRRPFAGLSDGELRDPHGNPLGARPCAIVKAAAGIMAKHGLKPQESSSAFDGEGHLVGFYPASVGSREKPAPTGVYKVRGIALNPTYHYDPKFAFKGVKVKHKTTISPGPNNPVGVVWIDLSVRPMGIHGTPTPENIGRTESHGCIRLTSWDALDLASRVSRGAIAVFSETEPRRVDMSRFSR